MIKTKWISAYDDPVDKYKHLLIELLAIIHRDGGHQASIHGIEQSVEDAAKIVSRCVQCPRISNPNDECYIPPIDSKSSKLQLVWQWLSKFFRL